MRITTLRWLPIVLQLRAFVCLCMFVCTHNKMTVFIPRYFMTSAKPKKKKISCRFSCLFLWWIFWNLPNVEFLLLLVETVRSATLSGGSKLRTFHHSVFPLNILSVFVIRVNQLKKGSSPILTNFSTKTASPDLTISCFHFLLISVPDSDFSVTLQFKHIPFNIIASYDIIYINTVQFYREDIPVCFRLNTSI